MASKFIKSHSEYILRSNPNPAKDGKIFENDARTTLLDYNSTNGIVTKFTDGGFVYVVNSEPNFAKRNIQSKPTTIYEGNEYVAPTETDTSVNATIKTDARNLMDLCYFGSANAMLMSSIEDIILRFPAGLYIQNKSDAYSIDNYSLTISVYDDTNPENDAHIRNKLSLDLLDYTEQAINSMTDDLKVLKKSYGRYELTYGDGSFIANITGYTGYTTTKKTVTFSFDRSIYDISDNKILVIKPKPDIVNTFFDSLDDFQKVLLNRNSKPIYSSSIISPADDGDGVYMDTIYFKWPSTDGYNIDIDNADYFSMIEKLIEATNYMDELYSDNLYRVMTHDSIKTLDWSYSSYKEDVDDIIIGGTKIQKILRLYGRSFDELKKYIDGISNSNRVEYGSDKGLPVEYLQSNTYLRGWELSTLNKDGLGDLKTLPNLFPSTVKEFSVNEVTDILYKNLFINSSHIFRSKGTRKSIRKILGMLGIDESWYEIQEYVQEVESYISAEKLEEIARLNYSVKSIAENMGISDGYPEYNYSPDHNLFAGTNVDFFIKCPSGGSENFIPIPMDSNENLIIGSHIPRTSNEYAIANYPLSKPVDLNKDYTITISGSVDKTVYQSQRFGAYMGLTELTVDTEYNPDSKTWIGNIKIIEYDDNWDIASGITICNIGNGYGWATINWIKLEEGKKSTTWRGADSDNIDDKYGICLDENYIFPLISGMTGYPSPELNNPNFYFQEKGFWYRETGGVHDTVSGGTYVTEMNDGNNPHIGSGLYDYGYSYVNRFEDIFRGFTKNRTSSGVEYINDYLKKGFTLKTGSTIDNLKIHYSDNRDGDLILNLKNLTIGINGDNIIESFMESSSDVDKITIDENSDENALTINGNSKSYINIQADSVVIISISDNAPDNSTFIVHNKSSSTHDVLLLDKDILPGETYRISIKRGNGEDYVVERYYGDDEFGLIKSISLPYLEQIVPSTAMLNFILINRDKPIWQVVDRYISIDDGPQYNGREVLAYKNINPYYNSNKDETDSILVEITKEFGSEYVKYTPNSEVTGGIYLFIRQNT